MERTFLLILPEWVKRNMVGQIITRLENLGLKLIYLKMVRLDEDKDLVALASHVSVHYKLFVFFTLICFLMLPFFLAGR